MIRNRTKSEWTVGGTTTQTKHTYSPMTNWLGASLCDSQQFEGFSGDAGGRLTSDGRVQQRTRSPANLLEMAPSQAHEMLCDARANCLAGLGGVAGRGISDNMKTAVDRDDWSAIDSGLPG